MSNMNNTNLSPNINSNVNTTPGWMVDEQPQIPM